MANTTKDSGQTESATASLNPQALAVNDAATLLSKASGERITPAMIESDLTSGAPRNPDGTVHLVHYAAWLLKEEANAE
jgi:hypothetical protein